MSTSARKPSGNRVTRTSEIMTIASWCGVDLKAFGVDGKDLVGQVGTLIVLGLAAATAIGVINVRRPEPSAGLPAGTPAVQTALPSVGQVQDQTEARCYQRTKYMDATQYDAQLSAQDSCVRSENARVLRR